MTRWLQSSILAGFVTLLTPMPIPAAQEEIPVRTMSLAFGAMAVAVAIVAIALYFSTRAQRDRQKLVEQCIEQGREIPPGLMPQIFPTKKQAEFTRRRDIRRGIWLLCWGLGLGLVAYITSGDIKSAAFSLLFLILGAGSFVNAMFFSGRPDPDRIREKDA